MTKLLHTVRIYYEVVVVADSDWEFATDVAKDCICDILDDLHPEYKYEFEYTGSIYSVEKDSAWYDVIPYGDADGKPCQYYTSEAEGERKAVVEKVKNMLTPKEWDALTAQLCDESN